MSTERFLLRIGVPVLLILGVGYLLVRYAKAQVMADIQSPAEAAGLKSAEWAPAVTIPPLVPCWEQLNCAVAQRALCPARKRSHVPCWLAVQVAEGQLRPGCAFCEMYRLERRQPPYLRMVKGGQAGREEAAACASDGAAGRATGT